MHRYSSDPTELGWSVREIYDFKCPGLDLIPGSEGKMVSTQSLIGIHKAQLEDPLAYLPRSNIRQYRRGEVIYDESKPLTYLYLQLSGSVMVSRVPTRGRHIVIDVHQPDDFFGESVLLGYPCTSEQALAAEDSRVMSWTRNDIEHIISCQPRFALALIQVVVQRAAAYAQRIESLCSENVQQRLVRLLLELAGRTGAVERDGGILLKPMTHQLMSRYLGTTREVVSLTMNHLKRLGYVRYSRAAIIIDNRRLQTLER